jgi:hypothetical protein
MIVVQATAGVVPSYINTKPSYNTSGVKHALGTANHEYEHHLAFIITCDINETVV